MPNQPGCSMFPLENRPKQTRQRRKKTTPGYLILATDSALGSTSSGSGSSVGPIRHSRAKRARKQDGGILGIGPHYDNWAEPFDDQRSPTSTEGTAPKTPDSWGSSMSAVSPPGRRGAVSEGTIPITGIPPLEPHAHGVARSTSEEWNSPVSQTIHGPLHMTEGYLEPYAFASNPHAPISTQTILQCNHDHSLIQPPNAPFSYELAARAFNPVDAPPTQPTGLANDFWTNTPSAPSQLQYPPEHCYPQAADCFSPHYLSSSSVTGFPFDAAHYPEIEQILPTQAELHVPGAYPPSPGASTSVLTQGVPGRYVENLNPFSSTMVLTHAPSTASYHDSNMHFASPNE